MAGFQPGCLWSGLSLLYLRIICLPAWVPGCLWSGPRLPLLYLRIIRLPAWVPLVRSPAFLALCSNHLSPGLGAWVPLVGSPAASAVSSNHSSPSLGASGQVSGFSCFIFKSFVSRPGCLGASGRASGLFLYIRIICLPAWVPLVGLPAASALSSNHLSLGLGTSGQVSGYPCFTFESFVSQPRCLWSSLSSNHSSPSLGASGQVFGCFCFVFEPFVSQPGCLLLSLQLLLLYLPSICLSAWVPLVGPLAFFALSSNHLSPNLGAWVPLVGPPAASALSSNLVFPSLGNWVLLVTLVRSPAFLALCSNHLSPGLGAWCLVSLAGSLFESFVCFCFIFESFVSHAGCFWSGLRLPLLYLPSICLSAWVPLVGPLAFFALSSNHLSPNLGAWVPLVGPPAASALSSNLVFPSLGNWVLLVTLVRSPAFLALCSNHLSPGLGAWCLVPLVGSPAIFALCSNHLSASALSSNHLSPTQGASGRASGSLCFIFEPFVFQLGCFWSGLRLRIICLPAWVPLVGSLVAFALSSNHLSPSLGALVGSLAAFALHSNHLSPSLVPVWLPLLYLRTICLPACVPLVVIFDHFSPGVGAPALSWNASSQVSGGLCFIFESFVSHPGRPCFYTTCAC